MMSHTLKKAIALTLSFAAIAPVAEAHMLRDRSFDFANEFTLPFDEIGEMLTDLPEQSSGNPNSTESTAGKTTKASPPPSPVVTPPASAPPTASPSIETVLQPSAPSHPVVTGEAVEILNTYNKMTVGHGNAQPPVFTIHQPMMLTYMQTYHWNGGRGTAQPGQIGLLGQGAWQAEGNPGMGNVPNAEWIAKPNVVLPAGTYTVTDSETASWAHNSHSTELGFVVVRAAPVSGAQTSAAPIVPKLSERQALEKLTSIKRLKEWVLAVRANGNSVVYDLTSDPTEMCTQSSCNWCFRMQEDTPSHRTYFETYCVDAMSGRVSAKNE